MSISRSFGTDLESPPHIRSTYFPQHPDLTYLSSIASLNIPSHPRASDDCKFREGIVVSSSSADVLVDIGLRKSLKLRQNPWIEKQAAELSIQLGELHEMLPIGTRVTVAIDDWRGLCSKLYSDPNLGITGYPVSPDLPSSRPDCLYWGYRTRWASCLSEAVNQGFDVVVGIDASLGTPLTERAGDYRNLRSKSISRLILLTLVNF